MSTTTDALGPTSGNGAAARIAEVAAPGPTTDPHPPRGVVHDVWVVARRGLVHMKRQPEALSDATIQPIMFVLLFAYVFGGAIDVPGGGNYREFLMGGIMAQTIVFTSFGVAMSLANDRKNQAVDRFRSLPIAKGAVLGGHAVANLIKAFLPIAIMSVTGLIVGWRIRTSFLEALAGFVLLVLFAYAISWVMAYVALLVPSVEVINNASFMVIFPLTFIANTFVPSESLPGPLKAFAEWNPVSAVTQAARDLFGNIPPGTPTPDAWSLQNPVLYTLIWIVVIVAVFAPLSVHRYTNKRR